MPFDKAPNYDARLAAQESFESGMLSQQKEHDWSHPTGSYGEALLVEGLKPRRFAERNGRKVYLSGLEVFLHDLAENLLNSKPKDQPVVLLDMGGGAGLSWSRLAQVFEREVMESRLAFVVTNLVLSEDEVLQTYGSEDSFLARNPQAVNFISGRFTSLKDRSITLPNNREIGLVSNVDVVHDRKAPTAWSKVPERDISEVGHLLSAWGMYLVSNQDIQTLQAVSSPEEERNRSEGIRLAHTHLESAFALRRVVSAEAGPAKGKPLTYTVFKSPNSPLLNVRLS